MEENKDLLQAVLQVAASKHKEVITPKSNEAILGGGSQRRNVQAYLSKKILESKP